MLLGFFISVSGKRGLQFIIMEACGEAAQRHSNMCEGPIRFSGSESGNCCTEEAKNLLKSWL